VWVIEASWDGEGYAGRTLDVAVQACRRALYDKKVASLTPRGDVAQSLRTEGKLQMPRFQEKQRVEIHTVRTVNRLRWVRRKSSGV
jgi:hypothetical protein